MSQPHLRYATPAPSVTARTIRRSVVLLAVLLAGCAGAPPASDVPVASDRSQRHRADDAPASTVPQRLAPSRGMPAAQASPESALRTAFERARLLVAADAGIDLSTLALHLVADGEVDARVRRETERLIGTQFSNPAYARAFTERVMQSQSGTYAALYVARENAVLVSERALEAFMRSAADIDTRRAALLALMIHEVVHAADDRLHDIDNVRTLDFRAAFTQSAVFEGHAQWATRRLCEVQGCLNGLDALDRFMFGDPATVDPVVQSGVALSRNVLEYAYVEGERFIESVASRSGGKADLSALLSAPPVDPIQILNPDSWPDDGRERRNQALVLAARNAHHPWNDGSAGVALRATVDASPLKGINLRDDPARRRAALDGFTRLLVAMSALELHDQRDPMATPISVTLLQAESDDTAELFARTLYANNRARDVDAYSAVQTADGTTLLRTGTTLGAGRVERSLVAVNGSVILQLAATDSPAQLMDDYVLATFEQLATVKTASIHGLMPSWLER